MFVAGTPVATGYDARTGYSFPPAYAITRNQPLLIALSNLHNPGGSGSGTLRLTMFPRKEQSPLLRLSAVCMSSSLLEVNGSGTDASIPPGKTAQIEAFVFFRNGYAFPLGSGSYGPKSRSAIPLYSGDNLTSSTSGTTWTIRNQYKAASNSDACGSPGDKGVVFASLNGIVK
jgi:hypothetical protein